MDVADSIIIEKLNLLIKLKITELIHGRSYVDQVELLSSAGLQPKEIGEFLNKTANHISVTLNAIKKKKEGKS